VFCTAGVPGPRLKFAVQHVELIDEVMFDFPELTFVTRHGCEPWADLAVKLMLKWPGLHFSTSAFAPRYYPKAVIDFANTRGADKVIYAGYFPMGLSLQRIMKEMPGVGFKDEVWPKFLRGNALRVLGLSG
jgi:predicted TIM-barrel fold metal-dependent hydrolase